VTARALGHEALFDAVEAGAFERTAVGRGVVAVQRAL
jgi:hypothetical protein